MRLFVSALEPSSNVHLKSLLAYLDKKSLELTGIFDPNLIQSDKHASANLFSPEDFSIMGFLDVVKKLPFLLKAISLCAQKADDADVVLLMDASSFNLRLSKKLSYKDRVIYYILPQIWAWKPWRIDAVVKSAGVLCAILPFELEIYARYFEKKGLDSKKHVFRNVSDYDGSQGAVVYVGHPLLDIIKEEDFRDEAQTKEHLVFMPGSRPGEIQRIFPIFRELARHDALVRYSKVLVIPQILKNSLYIYGDVSGFELSFDTKSALKSAKFAFICSGTATLEAALLGVPFTLAYVASRVDYLIFRKFIKLNYIGLANLMYERMEGGVDGASLHDELIQEACTPAALLKSFLEFDTKSYAEKVLTLRSYLKEPSARNVSRVIEFIQKQL